MRLQLTITPDLDGPSHVVYTNLLCIAEWEEKLNRKVSDGRGIGLADLAFWAHFLLKLGGKATEPDYKTWIANHPDADIQVLDQTNPNPTDGAPTDAN